jgi:hypothetical protein
MAFFSRARYWQRNRRASRHPSTAITSPPSSGASLLTLPTEIRLSIFEHVFDNQKPITLFNGSDAIVLVNSAQRDPKETTNRPNRRNRTDLLRVCRQIHNEAEDVFFDRTLFGIIASPYQEPARVSHGVEVHKALPPGCIPASTLRRIRRVLFVMQLRGWTYAKVGYRVGDLRYLQAMTALREIRIVLTAPSNVSVGAFNMAPIRAIMENVPISVRVRIGPQSLESSKDDESETHEEGVDSSSQTAASKRVNVGRELYAYVQKHVNTLGERRGVLSGSTVDHSLCSFQNCVEGKSCVNSEMKTPPPKKQKAVARFLNALTPKEGPNAALPLRRI